MAELKRERKRMRITACLKWRRLVHWTCHSEKMENKSNMGDVSNHST